jgi:2-hydroxy-6-oxonona-2,4-dienedioate hydrolase
MAVEAAAIDIAVDRFRSAERTVFAKYRLAVRERFVDLDPSGERVRVIESGEGPPVILLPGLGAVAALWSPLLAGLRGVRGFAVERPGCGLSDPMRMAGLDLRSWSLRLVSSVVDALGVERVSLVGNSIGGTMSLWYALAHPERVERLVLFGAPPFVLDTQAPFAMRALSIPFVARRALARSGAADIDDVFVQMGHPSGILGAELAELAVSARGLPGFADGFVGLLHGATGIMGRRVAAPAVELAKLQTPTLMIWGSGDTHGPVETGRRMVATMPNASLEVCGRGHLPWLDEPERCAALAGDFLGSK